MKLLYTTSIQLPSRRANRLQTIAMAGEFQKLLGDNFYLGGTGIKEISGIKIVNFFGTTKSFILGFKYARFIIKNGITHVFTREEKLLFFIRLYLGFFGKKITSVYEAHFVPPKSNIFFYHTLKNIDGVVVLTELMKKEFEKKGIKTKIIVAPDGVDIQKFSFGGDKQVERAKLGLPLDKKIVLYTGHLYPWKGAHVLAEAVRYLSKDFFIVFVGGTENDIKDFRSKYGSQEQILIVGHKDHKEISLWQFCADILVLPNSGKEDISKFYTSPLKLFEYMASGVPIVASDLPSIREILNEENSLLVSPDNPQELARGISELSKNRELSQKLANRAKTDVIKFSWANRANKIIDLIQNKNSR